MLRFWDIAPQGEKEIFIPSISGSFDLDRVHVQGRLDSTRSGISKSWAASKSLREVFPPTAYQPYIDLLLTDVHIQSLGWGAKLDPKGTQGSDEVRLAVWGSLVVAPFFLWCSEALDCTRRAERWDLFAMIQERLFRREPCYTQGHLNIFQCDDVIALKTELEGADLPFGYAQRPEVLFNHAVWGRNFRAVGLDNHRLIIVEEGPVVVSSPDHILEPVILGKGVWFLTHPFPRRRYAD